MFLFDGALSMAFVINGSARQAITPDRLLSRISSGGIVISGFVSILGNLYAGGAAEVLNPRIALGFCSLRLLLIIVVCITLNLKLRNSLEDVEPLE